MLLILIFILSFLAFIVGMINPKWVIKKLPQTQSTVALLYIGLIIISLELFIGLNFGDFSEVLIETLVLLSVLALIIGIFSPQAVLPKFVPRNRGIVILFYLGLSIIIPSFWTSYKEYTMTPEEKMQLAEERERSIAIRDSLLKQQAEKSKILLPVVTDSLLISKYVPQFDSLYTELLTLDKPQGMEVYSDRSTYHKKIQHLLFEEWWDEMEKADSTHTQFKPARKKYEDCCKKYDKQYARYQIYGDEDLTEIKFWAENRAEQILRKICVDPKSLVIEQVQHPRKIKTGWKCMVIYRAKNGFGGYVRESLTLVLKYNADDGLYECIDVY